MTSKQLRTQYQKDMLLNENRNILKQMKYEKTLGNPKKLLKIKTYHLRLIKKGTVSFIKKLLNLSLIMLISIMLIKKL